MHVFPPPGISLSLTRSLLLFFFLFSSRLLARFVSNSKWRKNGEKTTQKDALIVSSVDDSCAAKERMSDDEADENDEYLSQFVVAKVLEITQIPNKDNLKVIRVDAGGGGEDDVLSIVTNAKNVSEIGLLIAIARVGATLKDGTVIKKQLVGGEMSSGMVLDAPLLNWKSGSHGLAAILPSDETKPLWWKAGDKVPKSRPRSDGLAGNDDDTNGKKEEPVVDTMFARKLSKEEKKAALEAKRAARAAKKAGGDE